MFSNLSKINKKKLINLILISLSIVIMFYILFSNNDLNQIYDILKNIQIGYILIAILSIFVFWFFESYMIYILITKFTNKKKNLNTFWLALKTTMLGQYYSNITPFASGGQPVQLYLMKDESIPISSGTAVLVTKFLLYQVGVTIYSLFLAIYRIKQLISYSSGVSIFVLTGLTLNILMISTIILIAFKPKIIVKFTAFILKFLYKYHIVKDIELISLKINNFISEYEISIGKLKEEIKVTFIMFFITFLQLTAFFSITYFIYKSLNLSGSNLLEVICLQSFLYMAVSFIPTPGTVGASEFGFMLLLGHVFPSNLIGTALILWRGISYYFSLIFSGTFYLAIMLSKNKTLIN